MNLDFTKKPPLRAPVLSNNEKSPWASINDVLIQNRCWLCEQYFPRGKVKKVFQVSDLLTFYHNHMKRLLIVRGGQITNISEESEGNNASETKLSTVVNSENSNENEELISTDYQFISPNLQRCYESYVELMNAGDGKPTKLFEVFGKNDMEVWMSGLVCGGSDECRQELAYFVPDTGNSNRHTPSDGSSANTPSRTEVNSMFSFAVPRGTDCPPGCGCDNPWPFMP